MGFLYSARKEHKGNCVRGLINWGSRNFDWHKAALEARRLDLCVNVFKDGRNGLYAPMETEVRHPDESRGWIIIGASNRVQAGPLRALEAPALLSANFSCLGCVLEPLHHEWLCIIGLPLM